MESGWRKPYMRYKAYTLNMAKQYRERNDVRIYLELLLSLATISIFSIFALKPTLITIAELLKDIESKEETIVILDEKIEKLRLSEQLYDRNIETVKLLESAIPTEPEPEKYIKQIEGLVSTNPSTVQLLNIDSVTLLGEGKPTPDNNKNMHPLPGNSSSLTTTMRIEGNYSSLSSFLKDLEKIRRPLKIDTVAFDNEETKEGSELTLTTVGRLPYIKREE